ncbi:MAG: beta-lactamase family protein [Pseudomonadales bacterium]|nr:beta-lactamase family protein [Pseudomonadales bacterium]
MHAGIQTYIDNNILAGASAVVLKDNHIVDFKTWGYADIETQRPVAEDTIFRIYSNTKIVTSVAAMCLHEDGCFALDDPIEKHLPQLADRQVLRKDATDIADTEPASSKGTIRQLMSHSAGFSYGFLQECPTLDKVLTDVDIMGADSTLAEMVDKLGTLPLAYHPGERWQYSVSADILARLVEVWSGKTFIEFLQERIFGPLDMVDTDFYVPESKHARFATNYVPVNPMQPMEGGLNAAPDLLIGGYLKPKRFMSGGGGLVSTIGDYTSFIRMLVGEGEFGGVRILAPETVRMMHTNQLPVGVGVQLPNWFMPDTVFGLGLAIKTAPREGEPAEAIDEFHWGGMAGTHSWISPRAGLAALIFTQRLPGFWHPFSHDFKRLVYQAVSA